MKTDAQRGWYNMMHGAGSFLVHVSSRSLCCALWGTVSKYELLLYRHNISNPIPAQPRLPARRGQPYPP
ncbi:hypothetical protein IG631_22867 [Alternaria alternata]|jgi:hypothetical protein|nr:hypothetical protein IG631_22867 [Alternaria alternata]